MRRKLPDLHPPPLTIRPTPLLLIALALSLAAALPARAQDRNGSGHNPLAGSRVYGQAGCAACHTVRGHGGGDAPDLARVEGSRTLSELGSALWNHVGTARPDGRAITRRASIGADEAGDLVAFLAVLGYFRPEGDPERGRRLFDSKNCVDCHQVGNRGGVVGPDLDFLRYLASPIEVAVAMWNHGPRMTEELRSRGIPRPRLSDGEFVDLVAFLRSASPEFPGASIQVLPGDPASGSRLFRTKRCIRCHGVPGQGGRVGPDLAGLARERSPLLLASAMWNHQPEMGEAARRRGLELPRLDPGEMSDLVAYLSSVGYRAGTGRSDRGRAVLRRRRCLECHSLEGRGEGSAAPLESYPYLGAPGATIALLWNHVPLADSVGPPRSGWPSLEPDEVEDLSAFLADLDERR